MSTTRISQAVWVGFAMRTADGSLYTADISHITEAEMSVDFDHETIGIHVRGYGAATKFRDDLARQHAERVTRALSATEDA